MFSGAQFIKMKVRMKSFSKVLAGGSIFFVGLNLYKGNERFYEKFVMPIVHFCDPETAHNLAVKAATYGLVPRGKPINSDLLVNHVWGLRFENPVGVAAGFDKHCEAAPGLFKAGYSHVETGTVTPKPQSGNPLPRVFRLKQDKAVINRYGFNSVGHDVFRERLEEIVSNDKKGIIGVSVGKNKESENVEEDYILGIEKFGRLADYIAVNVSSPNTPGLRNLQKADSLDRLVKSVMSARDKLICEKKVLILVKIMPDLEGEQIKSIAKILMKHKVDGIIISNTTTSRPKSLISEHKTEAGGLSGEPVKAMSTAVINEMYSITKGTIPIIGVGGIASGADAYDKIKAGASLLQIYTSMIYHGPAIVNRINHELLDLLRSDGFSNINDAIGSNHRKS